jgi:hypothetical protein
MKTKIFASLLILSGIFIASGSKAEVEKRNVPSFSEISLRISGNVYIEQGSPQSVEIEAKPSTLEKIITEVKDGKLIIKFEDGNFFWRSFTPGEITVRITVPDINALSVSGSGDIIAKNIIKSKNMDLAISGSGNIKLSELNADEVKASISGSGDIVVEKGSGASKLTASISGSGNVKAGGFEAKNVKARIAGSGNATVYATENLNVSIAGSGDVYYNGSPSVDSSVAGSGSVRKVR